MISYCCQCVSPNNKFPNANIFFGIEAYKKSQDSFHGSPIVVFSAEWLWDQHKQSYQPINCDDQSLEKLTSIYTTLQHRYNADISNNRESQPSNDTNDEEQLPENFNKLMSM